MCIVAKGSASEELIRDNINGFCLEEFDYQAVAEKVKFILDAGKNKQTLDLMRENNLEFTRGHSWQEISSQVEKMYLKLLESGKI